MNTESIHLSLTTQEADSLAHVLQTTLRTTTMLPRERTATLTAANVLFQQLGYGHYTDEKGKTLTVPSRTEFSSLNDD